MALKLEADIRAELDFGNDEGLIIHRVNGGMELSDGKNVVVFPESKLQEVLDAISAVGKAKVQ